MCWQVASRGQPLALDGDGNVFVTGSVECCNYATLDRYNISSPSNFIVKLDGTTGQPTWVGSWRGQNLGLETSVAIGEQSSVYVSTTVSGPYSLDFGNGLNLTGGSATQAGVSVRLLAAKFSSASGSSAAVWARIVTSFSSTATSLVSCMVVSAGRTDPQLCPRPSTPSLS